MGLVTLLSHSCWPQQLMRGQVSWWCGAAQELLSILESDVAIETGTKD